MITENIAYDPPPGNDSVIIGQPLPQKRFCNMWTSLSIIKTVLLFHKNQKRCKLYNGNQYNNSLYIFTSNRLQWFFIP